MSTSSAHIRKRQYQASISSYFSRSSSDGSITHTVSPLSPPLPAETQASLLSVGMRVRKSIPEGYKTHKTVGALSFPFPSSAPPTAPPPVRPMFYTEHSRELAPFCGIHKIGGYASQPSPYTMPPSSAPSRLSTSTGHSDDFARAVPALSMSQSTSSSTQSSMASSSWYEQATSKKRGYEAEIEDDMDDIFDELDAEEEQALAPMRPIAKARGTPRKAMVTERVAVVDDDFEEAPFLVPMEVGM